MRNCVIKEPPFRRTTFGSPLSPSSTDLSSFPGITTLLISPRSPGSERRETRVPAFCSPSIARLPSAPPICDKVTGKLARNGGVITRDRSRRDPAEPRRAQRGAFGGTVQHPSAASAALREASPNPFLPSRTPICDLRAPPPRPIGELPSPPLIPRTLCTKFAA